jgi:DNA-binding transcriptional MerR regulator
MKNFILYVSPTWALACQPAAETAFFSLETVARLTGVHSDLIGYYCRLGLLSPAETDWRGDPLFTADAIDELRRIEHYRRHLGVHRRALPLIRDLRRAADDQCIELHFLHHD